MCDFFLLSKILDIKYQNNDNLTAGNIFHFNFALTKALVLLL